MDQFNFSKNNMRKANSGMLIFSCFAFFCILVFVLFIFDFNIREALFAVGIMALITTLTQTIGIFLITRSSIKMKVLIYEDKIIKQCGKYQQTALWDNINKIKLTENPEGSVFNIRLYQKDEKAIDLGCFDEMDKMARLIRNKISDNVLVQMKRYRKNCGDIIIPIMTCIIPLVFVYIIASMGTKAMDICTILFPLIISSGILIFRPLTEFNLKFKWFEIIFAALLIILVIYYFIVYL